MDSNNLLPSGEGTVTTYPTAGWCSLCKQRSTELYRVSKGKRTVNACGRCLGKALGRPKSAGRHH